jgi:DNA-directed RNA polymerase specialized sigma24 family protein
VEPTAGDVALAAEVLASLSGRDREALIRFYLDQEEPDTITRECGLSDAEWKSIKTRARDLFRAKRIARPCATAERAPGPQRIRA